MCYRNLTAWIACFTWLLAKVRNVSRFVIIITYLFSYFDYKYSDINTHYMGLSRLHESKSIITSRCLQPDRCQRKQYNYRNSIKWDIPKADEFRNYDVKTQNRNKNYIETLHTADGCIYVRNIPAYSLYSINCPYSATKEVNVFALVTLVTNRKAYNIATFETTASDKASTAVAVTKAATSKTL